MSECAKCTDPAALLFDWNCAGCRAKLLANLPDRRSRQCWIDRWRDNGEEAMAAAVIDKLRERHESNR